MNGLGSAGRPAGRVEPSAPVACVNGDRGATTVEPHAMLSLSARPPAGRLARLRAQLGERDMAVLSSLAKCRLLTGQQVCRLHMTDGSPATQARRARALLQRLADLKLVVRLGRRIGGVRAGSAGYVYGLSGYGQAVLAVDDLVGGRRRRVWETSPSFMDHVLAVAEVYVAVIEAERAGQAEVVQFDAEPACWRRFAAIGGQTVTLKPDGYVQLGVGDIELSAFIEMDMGTESAPTIARKLRVYAAYWRSGIEQNQRGVFPRVVWLANNPRSLGRISAVLHRLPREVQHLFAISPTTNGVAALTDLGLGGPRA